MNARKKLDEFIELMKWDKNKLLGLSEAADFADWYATEFDELQQKVDDFAEQVLKLNLACVTQRSELLSDFAKHYNSTLRDECISKRDISEYLKIT